MLGGRGSASAGSSSGSGPADKVTFFQSGKEIAKAIPVNCGTLLLGECTHGTEEFYRLRAEISKYLIEARQFKVAILFN